MSTERSRQRAYQRSIEDSTSSKVRKYHFTTLSPTRVDNGGWSGVVLPPYYKKTGPKGIISLGTRYNVHGVVAHLFFWERAAIPRPNKSAQIPDEFELVDYCHNEILSHPTNDKAFSFSSETMFDSPNFNNRTTVRRSEILDTSDIEWENQVQTFFALEKRSPGSWALADPFFQHRKLTSGRSLLVRLYDAVPVPAAGVELLQIVEFKDRHRDELKALRSQLNRLFLKIERAKEGDFAFAVEFSDLKGAIADLIHCMERRRLPMTLSSIDARMIWDFDYRAPVAAGLAVGTFAGLKTALLAAAGSAVANLLPRAEASISPGRVKSTGNPLAYAYLISREFGREFSLESLDSINLLKPYQESGTKTEMKVELHRSSNKAREISPPRRQKVRHGERFVIEIYFPSGLTLYYAENEETIFIENAKEFDSYEEANRFLNENIERLGRGGGAASIYVVK